MALRKSKNRKFEIQESKKAKLRKTPKAKNRKFEKAKKIKLAKIFLRETLKEKSPTIFCKKRGDYKIYLYVKNPSTFSTALKPALQLAKTAFLRSKTEKIFFRSLWSIFPQFVEHFSAVCGAFFGQIKFSHRSQLKLLELKTT